MYSFSNTDIDPILFAFLHGKTAEQKNLLPCQPIKMENIPIYFNAAYHSFFLYSQNYRYYRTNNISWRHGGSADQRTVDRETRIHHSLLDHIWMPYGRRALRHFLCTRIARKIQRKPRQVIQPSELEIQLDGLRKSYRQQEKKLSGFDVL